MKRNRKFKKNPKDSRYSKLSLFQKPDVKFFKPCPLSGKNATIIDYKNLKVLRKYLSESGRILPSRITSVSLKKQKELSRAVKRARLLAIRDDAKQHSILVRYFLGRGFKSVRDVGSSPLDLYLSLRWIITLRRSSEYTTHVTCDNNFAKEYGI